MIKKLIKFFIFSCICFIIADAFVNADIIQYRFMDYVSGTSPLKQTSFSANEIYTYNRDYVLFNGTERFFAFNYCATGSFEFGFPADYEGSTYVVGYSTGGQCAVLGYNGYNYTMYFMAKNVNDAGNGNSSIMFNTKVHNSATYNVFFQFLSLTSVSSIPAGVQIPTYNGEFNTLNTKIDSVDQAIQTLNAAQNQMVLEQQNTTNAVNDVNDTLNSNDVDSSNATDTLSDLSDSVASNSVISDLLLLPVRLFQNIVNNINGSCSAFNLGTLYNTNLLLPCINIPSLIGDTLWSVIDILFCGSFILVIRKKFVDIFESLSELKNGGNAVE